MFIVSPSTRQVICCILGICNTLKCNICNTVPDISFSKLRPEKVTSICVFSCYHSFLFCCRVPWRTQALLKSVRCRDWKYAAALVVYILTGYFYARTRLEARRWVRICILYLYGCGLVHKWIRSNIHIEDVDVMLFHELYLAVTVRVSATEYVLGVFRILLKVSFLFCNLHLCLLFIL